MNVQVHQLSGGLVFRCGQILVGGGEGVDEENVEHREEGRFSEHRQST